jgi:hypothetical protein
MKDVTTTNVLKTGSAAPLLTAEQKTALLTNMEEVTENAIQMYSFTVKGKAPLAKAYEDEMHAGIIKLSTLVKPFLDNSSDLGKVNQIIDELGPELRISKFIPVAKVACSLISMGSSVVKLGSIFGTPTSQDALDFTTKAAEACQHINAISNIYDNNAQTVSNAVGIVSQLVSEPMKLFGLTNSMPAIDHPEL